MMTDSDNGDDYLSDGAEEIEATMIEAQFEQSIEEKDALSMREGSFSRSSSSPNSRPSSVTAGRKSGTTDELVAGAEAISSDENSDAEDEEIPHTSESPKRSSPESKKEKKEKAEPREDLEDGEIETDSEDEEEKFQKEQESLPQQCQQHQQQPQPLMSLPKPFITPPMMLRNNNNRQFNNNRQKIDFPRQQISNYNQNNGLQNSNKRKRPEDCGVCKFYLRGNCTWNDKCKYNHPLGGQRMQWLADLGLPDPEIGYNPNRPRKSDTSRHKSTSPKDDVKRLPRIPRSRRQNSEKSEPKKSPRASPISSDDGGRSPSPKRIRQSPTAISVSSDDSRPPSRARTPLSLSPEGKRRIRSSSSEGHRSRSRSPIASSRTTDTTLGALLRKRRLESQSKQSVDSNPSSFLPGNISDSDDEETPAPPKNRAEAVRRFFNRDPNEIPSIFQPSSKMLSPPQSPTPQSITSSEDERDNEVFKSPSPPRGGSESPVPTTI
jgi:hypothetical protein